MVTDLSLNASYFFAKLGQDRDDISDMKRLEFWALAKARKIFSLYYPSEMVHSMHVHRNNTHDETIIHERINPCTVRGHSKSQSSQVIYDFHFLLLDSTRNKNEKSSFSVEVLFPEGVESLDNGSFIRIRWCDLHTSKMPHKNGDHFNVINETFVRNHICVT